MQQRIKHRLPALARAVISFFVFVAVGAHAADFGAARHRLQLEQQQHALDLSLRQSLRARHYDLSAADARRIDQLRMQQRLEQQQLDLDQLQRGRLLAHRPAHDSPAVRDSRLAVQREIFAQERALQTQRFELDQQRLLDAMRRQPLQPTPVPGRLNLP